MRLDTNLQWPTVPLSDKEGQMLRHIKKIPLAFEGSAAAFPNTFAVITAFEKGRLLKFPTERGLARISITERPTVETLASCLRFVGQLTEDSASRLGTTLSYVEGSIDGYFNTRLDIFVLERVRKRS